MTAPKIPGGHIEPLKSRAEISVNAALPNPNMHPKSASRTTAKTKGNRMGHAARLAKHHQKPAQRQSRLNG